MAMTYQNMLDFDEADLKKQADSYQKTSPPPNTDKYYRINIASKQQFCAHFYNNALQIYTYSGTHRRQKFILDKVNDKSYYIRNAEAGKYINYSLVAQETGPQQANCKWIFNGGNSFDIRKPQTNKCWDVNKEKAKNGSKIIMYEARGAWHQVWTLQELSYLA